MKGIIKLRKTSNIFYFLIFILSFLALLFLDDKNIILFNIEFSFDRINTMFAFLANLVFFLFNLLSKNSIRKFQHIFYPLSMILIILFNIILFTNSITLVFLGLFFIFLINYFLTKSKSTFSFDISTLFFSFVLISYGLLRYFSLNSISFSFLNIAQYQYRIDEFIINIAFFGFLILIFRLFNLLPYNLKAKNSHILGFNTMLYFVLGCNLLIKMFSIFSYYFYKNQSIIALYLLLNAVYFAIRQFKSKSIIEFLKLTLPLNIIISIFALFTYSQTGFISLIYSMIALILSYGAGFILSDLIEKKMGTAEFSSLKKIGHNDRLIRFFIFVIFLNIAHALPCAGLFSAAFSFLNIFLTESSGLIMTFAPYILFMCAFLLTLEAINVISKTLVEPIKPMGSFLLSFRQRFILYILTFSLFICSFSIEYIISQFIDIAAQIGNL
ncbi:hypothetical protein IJ531_00700 [bacterium]|nr:hypothetical protein [bacterium]